MKNFENRNFLSFSSSGELSRIVSYLLLLKLFPLTLIGKMLVLHKQLNMIDDTHYVYE